MFKLDIKSDLHILEDFEQFSQALQNIVKTSLDDVFEDSLEKLKKELYYTVNEKLPSIDKAKTIETPATPNLNIPKSDQELLNHFTGVDLNKIRMTKDYTSSIESNVVVSDNFRVRLRLPISPMENVEENFEKAVKFFNNALIAVKDGTGKVQYYLNPGIDMRQHVKIVCSRDNGITEKSSDKFDKYKNSTKMTRQIESEIGRYAEWSLKQSGMQSIRSSFVNITSIIDSVKQGNFEHAAAVLRGSEGLNNVRELTKKTEDLQNNTNLSPSTSAYSSIIGIIRDMKISKKLRENEVVYSLSTATAESQEETKLIDEINNAIFIWIASNETTWIDDISKKIQQLIEQFEGATNV